MATCHYTPCSEDFYGFQGARYCSKYCQLLNRIQEGDHGDVTPRSLYLHWLKKNHRFVEHGEGVGFIVTVERKKP